MLNKSSEIKVMTNVFECCLCVSSFIAGKVLRTVCGLQYKYSQISCYYYYRYLIHEVVANFNPHLGNCITYKLVQDPPCSPRLFC